MPAYGTLPLYWLFARITTGKMPNREEGTGAIPCALKGWRVANNAARNDA